MSIYELNLCGSEERAERLCESIAQIHKNYGKEVVTFKAENAWVLCVHNTNHKYSDPFHVTEYVW